MHILILNFFAYLLTLIIYAKHKRKIDLGFLCISAFTLSSLGACWYYSFDLVPLYYPNIRIVPLIYIYALVLLCITPFIRLRLDIIKKFDSTGYEDIFNALSILFGLCSVPVFINLLINLATKSFAGNVLNSMYESNIDNATSIFFPPIKPFFSVIRRFYDLIILLLCYNVFLKKHTKYNKIVNTSLLLGVLSFFLYAFQAGSRGGIVKDCTVAIGYFLIFSSIYNSGIWKNIVKKIRITAIVVFSSIVLGLSAISISRFTTGELSTSNIYMSQWISQYLGEGMIRFADVLWPLEKDLNGDKNFSYIKSLLNGNGYKNNDIANDVYESRIGIKTSVFYTFIGSFYLDFNVLGTIIVCVLIFFFLNSICNIIKIKQKIGFIELIIIVKFFCLFVTGFTSNVYAVMSVQDDEFIFWLCISIIFLMRVITSISHGRLKY